MTISAIGASSDLLTALLGRMTGTQATDTDTSASALTISSDSDTSETDGDSSVALTGSGKGDLSSQILQMLTMLQNQDATSSSDTTTSDAAADGGEDAIAQLFSAIDTDGDGSITQSEMESYITDLGGTTDQADTLFASLDSEGTGSVSADDLAAASGPPPGPPPGSSPDDSVASTSDTDTSGTSETTASSGSSSDSSDDDYDVADTNQDGYVSTSEYNAYYGVGMDGDAAMGGGMQMGMNQPGATMTPNMQDAFASAANMFSPDALRGAMNMIA